MSRAANENRRPIRLVHGRSVEWWIWQAVSLTVLLGAFAMMLGVKP